MEDTQRMPISCHRHDHRKQLKGERMYGGASFQKVSVRSRGKSFVVGYVVGFVYIFVDQETKKAAEIRTLV